MKSKICTRCKKNKSLEEYSTYKYGFDGKKSQCKECRKDYNHKRYDENKVDILQRAKKAQRKYRVGKYGITEEHYHQKYSYVDGQCEICSTKCEVLSIDHDHKSGKIRGLLCNKCNLGLGHFKDDFMLLQKAINYLKNNQFNN